MSLGEGRMAALLIKVIHGVVNHRVVKIRRTGLRRRSVGGIVVNMMIIGMMFRNYESTVSSSSVKIEESDPRGRYSRARK